VAKAEVATMEEAAVVAPVHRRSTAASQRLDSPSWRAELSS
jgi:hypothetical protein